MATDETQVIVGPGGEPLLARSFASVLDSIQSSLGRIEKSLDGKADKADLARIDERLTRLEGENRERELASAVHQEHRTNSLSKRQKWLAALAYAALIAATALSGVFAALAAH